MEKLNSFNFYCDPYTHQHPESIEPYGVLEKDFSSKGMKKIIDLSFSHIWDV